MARRRTPRARALAHALGRLARAQDGSFLVEALASSVLVVVVGFGVLAAIDRGTQLGGQQEAQAVAGNLAQAEQDSVRALPLAEQATLRRSAPRTIGGVTYTVASRTRWVNDASGEAECTTPGGSADYMKLATVVTWPAMATRKPVTLETIVTPGVRAMSAGQGSLAVQITDRAGQPVGGLALGLSGPATRSDATSAAGCVLWGGLDAGGYTLSFSRSPDWVTPDGAQAVSKPVTIAGGQGSNVALQYDRGGRLQTSFVTRTTAGGSDIPSQPGHAHATHSGGGGVSIAYPVSGSTATSGLLFAFTSPYTLQPDTCAAGEIPASPDPPSPESPPAPAPVTGSVSPGATTTTAAVRLPSPNIRVRVGTTPLVGATVVVTSPCGTVYRRTTTTGGVLADPGFPYGTLAICATDGTRQVTASRSNRNFNNSLVFNMTLSSTSTPGTC